MPKGTHIRTEETKRRLSESLRDFHRRKKISKGLIDFHKKKKISEEQKEKQQCPEEKNRFDSTNSRINDMSRDELLDNLTSVRVEIDRRIKLLAGDFRALTQLQDRQEKIETELEQKGMRLLNPAKKGED